jgi:hypothetical protein
MSVCDFDYPDIGAVAVGTVGYRKDMGVPQRLRIARTSSQYRSWNPFAQFGVNAKF